VSNIHPETATIGWHSGQKKSGVTQRDEVARIELSPKLPFAPPGGKGASELLH
jgi:hypothetical protein